jgi:murein DD-endopeptidase MepM/ murein hydrolase activator NlpD
LIVLLAGVGYIISDYLHIKNNLVNTAELEKQLSLQLDEISVQRKQIQTFAQKINQLKSELLVLNDFGKKIRTIVNAETDENHGQEGLFGIGGPLPEDLESDLALDQEKEHELIREMHTQTEQIELAIGEQQTDFESLMKSLKKQINLLASTPSIRPTTGWISSPFGYRKSPFTGKREIHKGLDIATCTGTPVKAPGDGKVTFTGRKSFLGKTIVIDHGHGMVTRYGHLSKILKKRGDLVKRGEIIGEVGNTGRTTGSHLHYEVHLNGVPVNPEKYIMN